MKQVLIFLFFNGIINCDKLDNTYLPPYNAQSSAGSNVIQPPAVADLRTKANLISGQYHSSNIPSGQYPSADVQNFPPSREYLPASFSQQSSLNGQNFGARFQSSSSSNKYSSSSLPANQYSSGNAPSGKYLATSGQSSFTNGQHPLPNVPPSVSTSSNGPFAQFPGKPNLFSKPTGPDNFAPSFSGQEPVYQHQGNNNPTAILRSTIIPNAGDGSYQYSYETENGISAREEGRLVNDAETAIGGYSYTSPEGENIVVDYVADANGFQAKGSHIPEIPEAIQKSIELNKAAAAKGGNQESQYQYQGLSEAPKAQYGASSQAGYQYQQGQNGAARVPNAQYGASSQAGYQHQGLNDVSKAPNTHYGASSQAGFQHQGLNDVSKAPNTHYGAPQKSSFQSDLGFNGGSSYHNKGSTSNSVAQERFGIQDSQGGYKY